MKAFISLHRISLACLFVLCLFVLVACGSKSGTTTGAPPAAPSATASAYSCGTINMGPTSRINGNENAQQNGDCFVSAFKQCQAASLNVNAGGVDTLTRHLFSVQKKSSSCVITDTVRTSIIPSKPQNATTYTCSNVTKTEENLRFIGCGKMGDIQIPLSSN